MIHTPPKSAGTKTQSNALWPDGVNIGCMYGTQISTDKHSSQEMAESVAYLLTVEGFGGERKVFPIRTWVSEPKEGKPELPSFEASGD